MDANNTVAESSPATPQTVEIPRDRAAYDQWRQTGRTEASTTPKQPKAREAAATSTNAPADGSASEGTKQESRKKSDAGTRLEELLADLKEAGLTPAELKTFRREAQKEASKEEKPKETAPETRPAAEKTEQPAGLKAPVKPKIEDFGSYEEFEAAKDKYYEDLADHRADLKLHERDQKAEREKQQKEVNDRLAAAKERYGADAEKTIGDTAKTIFNDAKVPSAIKAILNDSDVMVDLLYTLNSKDGELAEFVKLAKEKPGEALRKAVLAESLIKAELSSGSRTTGTERPVRSEGTAERDENGKFASSKEKPATKVTNAPPPPREVSGRNSAPPDEAEGAFKSGDFKAFQRAQNSRDLQRRQGR